MKDEEKRVEGGVMFSLPHSNAPPLLFTEAYKPFYFSFLNHRNYCISFEEIYKLVV